MTAKTFKNALSASKKAYDDKEVATMNWLRRHLRKSPSPRRLVRQSIGLQEGISLERPQTAPSTAAGMDLMAAPISCPVVPRQYLIGPRIRPPNQPPPRPPRPDTIAIQDIHAWLDIGASTAHRPLMRGVPYWRIGTDHDAGDTSDVRYAMPIRQEADSERPSTSHSHHLKSFYYRARRMNIRMPSLFRNSSHQSVVRKQLDRRSTSMPLLSVNHEGTSEVPRSMRPAGSNSLVDMRSLGKVSDQNVAPFAVGGQTQTIGPQQNDACKLGHSGDTECCTAVCTATVTSQRSRTRNSTQLSTAAAGVSRERSIGNFSDTPSYFSGPPPPSYRSRSVSALTTSSFGCIDGLNPEQRQERQRRKKGGVKGRLKRLARRAHLTL